MLQTNHMTTHTEISHNSDDLITLFADTFSETQKVSLLGGADEPLYLPARDDNPAEIHFRDDYFSSALHEIAHWCIAGAERRKQVDYGYWYVADGRDAQAQEAFFKAEVKPQALEWLFSLACDYPFRVSVDNVVAGEHESDWSYWEQLEQAKGHFQTLCYKQIVLWENSGLPQRGKLFMTACANKYRQGILPSIEELSNPETEQKHA